MEPSRKPLAIDLYAGLGGWTESLLAEGWDVIGFDIERHQYDTPMYLNGVRIGTALSKYPGQLVLQDVCTLHGAQFRNADLIVASPPCQEFSYRAMPWKRAKALPPPYLGMNLFWQCWRIQHEACEASGRYIPLVVENVNGAQRWVGQAQARFGSFFLWGDIGRVGDAVVGPQPVFGQVVRAAKRGQKENPDGTQHPQGSWFKVADSKNRGSKNGGGLWFAIGSPGQTNVGQNPDGRKVPGMNFHEQAKTGKPGRSFQSAAVESAGTKQGGDWFSDPNSASRTSSSRSTARKAASAQIAKIPEPLARHIAQVFKPR